MTHVKNDLVLLWWTQTYLTHHQHIDLVGFGFFFLCRMNVVLRLFERKKTLENQSISILLLAIVDTCSMLIFVCAHAACDQTFVSSILLKNWLINNCFCCCCSFRLFQSLLSYTRIHDSSEYTMEKNNNRKTSNEYSMIEGNPDSISNIYFTYILNGISKIRLYEFIDGEKSK